MGHDGFSFNSGINRRTYLEAIGAASISTGFLGSARAADDQYDTHVNIVEEGADNSGQELIDDVFREHANDDTLIKFPPGTYLANELILYKLSNFAMIGDDATLVPGDDYNETVWLGGGETKDIRIENFTIDNREDGVTPQVDINSYGTVELRNIEKVGYHEGPGIAIALRTLSSDAEGVLDNVRAPDGGDSVGIYLHGEGPMTVTNCQVEQFSDNGLYASNISAPVTVEGGTFRNNNISQVRLGSPDSAIRNATVGVSEPIFGSDPDTVNMRGIRIADGPGPVTVDNCDISMTHCQGSGGIVNAYSGGSLTVRDTNIHVGESYCTTGSGGSRTSYGILVDNATEAPAGERTIKNTSITGGGTYRSAMKIRRDSNNIDGLCVDQSGEGRDGIVFEDSSGNTLTNSLVDVPDEEVVMRGDSSVKKANVSTDGTCSSSSSVSSHQSAGFNGETGSVTHEQTRADEWATVTLDQQYADPVVIMNPLSHEGYHPCHPRVRSVAEGSFDFKFEEWAYLDGNHRAENAHYVAVDAGTQEMGGLAVEVGKMQTNHRFSATSFDRTFDGRPVVFAQSQTVNGTDPIVTRQRNVSADGMDVRLVEEEGEENGGYHYAETVGYLAVEPGTGSLDGRPFEVGVADGIDGYDSWNRIEFEGSYENPQFVADIQSYAGPNTAALRYRNLTSSSVELFVEEEQSADREMAHRDERVGYMVVESA